MADKMDTTAVGGMKISSRKLNDLEGAADSLFARALNLLPGDPKTFDDTVLEVSAEAQRLSQHARSALLRSFNPEFLAGSSGPDPAGILQLPTDIDYLADLPGISVKPDVSDGMRRRNHRRDPRRGNLLHLHMPCCFPPW